MRWCKKAGGMARGRDGGREQAEEGGRKSERVGVRERTTRKGGRKGRREGARGSLAGRKGAREGGCRARRESNRAKGMEGMRAWQGWRMRGSKRGRARAREPTRGIGRGLVEEGGREGTSEEKDRHGRRV